MRDSIIEALSHLEPEARERILRTVTTFFGIDPPHSLASIRLTTQHIQSRSPARTTTDLPVGREPEFGTHPAISPKEFLVEKSPQTDVERVVCLAFYLAHYRDVRYFKTADVSKLNTEAAQRKLANTTYSINTATQAGYIAPATKNAK